jgi:hypothetical protein
MHLPRYHEVLAVGMLGLTGCQPVGSPVLGLIVNHTQWGWVVTTNVDATKEGKACAETIMGLFAYGDASISAAKAAGGITKVSHVDASVKNFLGIVAEYCTIVKGS